MAAKNAPNRLILVFDNEGRKGFYRIGVGDGDTDFEFVDSLEDAVKSGDMIVSFSGAHDLRHEFEKKATKKGAYRYFFVQKGSDIRVMVSKTNPYVAYATTMTHLSQFPNSVVPGWQVLDGAVNWREQKTKDGNPVSKEDRPVYYIKIQHPNRRNNNIYLIFGLKGANGAVPKFKVALNVSNERAVLANYAQESGLDEGKVVELSKEVLFHSSVYPKFEKRILYAGLEAKQWWTIANATLLAGTLLVGTYALNNDRMAADLSAQAAKLGSEADGKAGERSAMISDNLPAYAKGMSIDYMKGLRFSEGLYSELPSVVSMPVELSVKDEGPSVIKTKVLAYDPHYQTARVLVSKEEALKVLGDNLKGENMNGINIQSISVSNTGDEYEVVYTFEGADSDFRSIVSGS